MKPKPLEALNHFTVPCSFTSHPRVRDSGKSRRYFELFCVSCSASWELQHGFRSVANGLSHEKKGRKDCPCSPSIKTKGITRAKNATKRVPQSAQFVHSYRRRAKTQLDPLK